MSFAVVSLMSIPIPRTQTKPKICIESIELEIDIQMGQDTPETSYLGIEAE